MPENSNSPPTCNARSRRVSRLRYRRVITRSRRCSYFLHEKFLRLVYARPTTSKALDYGFAGASDLESLWVGVPGCHRNESETAGVMTKTPTYLSSGLAFISVSSFRVLVASCVLGHVVAVVRSAPIRLLYVSLAHDGAHDMGEAPVRTVISPPSRRSRNSTAALAHQRVDGRSDVSCDVPGW
jgi:hypothetical protein